MNREFSFEKLIVYQKAKEYAIFVYSILKKFPSEEKYALCDQLRRASVSVVSNIAEGTSRQTLKDKVHFLDIAYGSLMETYSQLDLAKDFNYINESDLNSIRENVIEVQKLLAALKQAYINKLEHS